LHHSRNTDETGVPVISQDKRRDAQSSQSGCFTKMAIKSLGNSSQLIIVFLPSLNNF